MAFLNSVRCLKRAHSSVQTCTRAISTSWATPMPGAACSQLPMLASTAQPPVSWLNDFGFPPAGLPRVGDMPLDDAPFIGDLTPSAGINREIGDVLDSDLPSGLPGVGGVAPSMDCATKRTFQPSVIRKKRRHGFLRRLATTAGQRVLSRRRIKGRHFLSI